METLYDLAGSRLYLNKGERTAFMDAASTAPREVRSFCEVLNFTGCRLSEALALEAHMVDLDQRIIVFETLKRRQKRKWREVPIPDQLVNTLDLVHGLRENRKRRNEKLWSWSRVTAWRKVKAVMEAAQIEGVQASPKGLRHGYGVGAVAAGVPLNMVSKWMGHSKMETTAIYANALGDEQRQLAKRMWEI